MEIENYRKTIHKIKTIKDIIITITELKDGLSNDISEEHVSSISVYDAYEGYINQLQASIDKMTEYITSLEIANDEIIQKLQRYEGDIEIIRMRYIDGHSLKYIATHFDITKSAASQKLKKATSEFNSALNTRNTSGMQ